MKENREQGYVYLIRNNDNGLLKIGYTNNVDRRLKEIEKRFEFTGVKSNLVVEYLFEHEDYIGLETFLHKEFKKHRIQNEWFDIKDTDAVIEKGKGFVSNKKAEEKNIENDKIKTKDFLISKGYGEEVVDILNNFYFCLRGKKIEVYLDDNKEEVISELVEYVSWSKEDFKQNIENELFSETPTRSTFHIGLGGKCSYCYKVEFMIWLYEEMYGERAYEHLEFDIKNNFISYIFELQGESPKKIISDVTDVFGIDYTIEMLFEMDIDMRKTVLSKYTEEEIEEFRQHQEKNRSLSIKRRKADA